MSSKALSMISDLEDEGGCEIFTDNKSALFVTNRGIISTRLLVGNFPSADMNHSRNYSLRCNF